MHEKLTPQQYQAVHDRGGKLLVSAAAGSGKTKVLVDRLMTYMTDPNDPANMDEFLIITYTNAAASELRGKIAAKLTQKIAEDPGNKHLQKQLQRLYLTKISTVHGFCSDILREYAYHLDISADFRVADENECRELRCQAMDTVLEAAYQNIAMDSDFQSFVDTQGLGRDDRLVPDIIEKVYDSAKCHLNPEGWLDECIESAQIQLDIDASETVWGRFLMEDLFEYLDCQIHVLNQCCRDADIYPELEKVSNNLRSTIFQLMSLRDSTTWDGIVKNRKIDYGRLVFPKKNPDIELSERIKLIRNACKKGLEKKLLNFSDDSVSVLNDLQKMGPATKGLVALVRSFDKEYSFIKRRRRCLDFSDLEHKALDLFLGKNRSYPTSIAHEISLRFREIMVDEYQDSNSVQDAIFSALTEKRQNCFLVGDVKQSIYQFRLADPGIFLEKYHSYVPAEAAIPKQGRKVLLSHNFRSGPEIIDAVYDVFSACMRPKVGGLTYSDSEALREGIGHDLLPDAGVSLYAIEVQEETYPEEAAFVAEKIQTMLRDKILIRKDGQFVPVQPEDIVILLRSPGTAAGYFQHALDSRGIRCTSGGGTDLLKTQEIETFRSFLQIILNPRQDIPLISTLASPVFGFTADDLAHIRAKQKKGYFYEALLNDDSDKTVNFLLTLSQLRMEAKTNTLTGLLEKCISLTRMDSVYFAMPGGESKVSNLHSFYQLAAVYEKGSLRDVSQFLDHLNSLEDRGLVNSENNTSGAVTIMSIHKSKGLEFPVVFLCNLSRKFNQESLRARILCDKTLGLGLSIADQQQRIRYPSIAKKAIAVKMAQESVSEEMRVLYVAMTRAKDRLIMTYASRTLEDDILEIAMRQDMDDGELLCREAICLGDWILLAALKRTEAGELHALGARPMSTVLGTYPWRISVCSALGKETLELFEINKEALLPDCVITQLEKALSFSYPYKAATVFPSKQTATDRKGRHKDAEAAENTDESKKMIRNWRQPGFDKHLSEGKTYGSAIHSVMQYIDYSKCQTAESVQNEVTRLVNQGYISESQGSMVNCKVIYDFFATEIGKKLVNGVNHLREFKFSILEDGLNYSPSLAGEQILLQGVIDCAILEADGITVLDFKTDKVNEETLPEKVSFYSDQIQTYAEALGRIYDMPIKAKYLYFFRLNCFVEV